MNEPSLAGAMIGHMVGDYLLQNDWMAANKVMSSLVAMAHALIWTASVCICGGIVALPAVAWLLATHFAIDRWRLAPKAMAYTGQLSFRDNLSPWSMIVVDNTWHLVTILVAFAIWQ